MKRIIMALALVVGLAPSAWADEAAAIRELAEQGNAEAQFALGTLYRDGRGVAQDYGETLRWWRKSADQGLIDAQFALGNLYAGGAGIARDDVQAFMWYGIAASRTGEDWLHAIAGSNRDALVPRMVPADVARAERLVADWRAKHPQ